ncbi:MAG: flagellar hook-associated protein 3 [Halobacteriovoraceae bacterium]|nr:flagellar hook-associated protein 3 [Halobacteriovoraceae bacterium]|tara:strand:+ start:10384 stop:11424 length:1041 start_codon:yes stop_codon:yes gene_type:complete
MTRVSENSNMHAIKYSLGKTKEKMENLQLKGSTLRSITRPSDNPISNVEALSLKSRIKDNNQYTRNAEYAELHLTATEKSIEQITEILNKAKEIAIAQSSDFYDADIRKNVANEVRQLRFQALAIANKRIGNKYLFGGFKTLSKPFDESGAYQGDKGKITLEVSKDFFVPINLTGHEVFYSSEDTSSRQPNPFEQVSPSDANPSLDGEEIRERQINRDLASVNEQPKPEEDSFTSRSNVFSLLEGLSNSLENNDPNLTQSLLEKFDDSISRLVTMRTKVGSVMNSVDTSKLTNEDTALDAKTRKSSLVDADVTELFSDITRQQNILKSTYQASQGLMNKTLIDFLR